MSGTDMQFGAQKDIQHDKDAQWHTGTVSVYRVQLLTTLYILQPLRHILPYTSHTKLSNY